MKVVRSSSRNLVLSICLLGTAMLANASSESDRIVMTMAKAACDNRDYRSFFNALVMSPFVRQKYSAPKIQFGILGPQGKVVSARDIDAANYTDFPVRLEDYHFKPARPARTGDNGEYLYLEFNQSQRNDISVEWARIHYDGRSAGGDDLGNPVDAKGRRLPPGTPPAVEGQLMLRPTQDCWELSEDFRWLR